MPNPQFSKISDGTNSYDVKDASARSDISSLATRVGDAEGDISALDTRVSNLTVDDLANVNITNPTTGQAMVYDGENNEWINSDGVNVREWVGTSAELAEAVAQGDISDDTNILVTDDYSVGGSGLLPHIIVLSAAGSTLTVLAPDGETVIVPTQVEGSTTAWEFDAEAYGNYTIRVTISSVLHTYVLPINNVGVHRVAYVAADNAWINIDTDGGKPVVTQEQYTYLRTNNLLEPDVDYHISDANILSAFREVTRQQYDNLPSTKTSDDVCYYINDLNIVEAEIDDTSTSTTKVWSSNKTNGEISSLSQQLTANNVPFRFGYDSESGKYGYILNEGGADTVIPFSSGGGDLVLTRQNISFTYEYDTDNPLGGYSAWTDVTLFESNTTYLIVASLDSFYNQVPACSNGEFISISSIQYNPHFRNMATAELTDAGNAMYFLTGVDPTQLDYKSRPRLWVTDPICLRNHGTMVFKVENLVSNPGKKRFSFYGYSSNGCLSLGQNMWSTITAVSTSTNCWLRIDKDGAFLQYLAAGNTFNFERGHTYTLWTNAVATSGQSVVFDLESNSSGGSQISNLTLTLGAAPGDTGALVVPQSFVENFSQVTMISGNRVSSAKYYVNDAYTSDVTLNTPITLDSSATKTEIDIVATTAGWATAEFLFET